MKQLSAGDLRSRNEQKEAVCGKASTLERVRRFQEADQKLQEACARLGIEKPHMVARS
jgi:hypothetical protein